MAECTGCALCDGTWERRHKTLGEEALDMLGHKVLIEWDDETAPNGKAGAVGILTKVTIEDSPARLDRHIGTVTLALGWGYGVVADPSTSISLWEDENDSTA